MASERLSIYLNDHLAAAIAAGELAAHPGHDLDALIRRARTQRRRLNRHRLEAAEAAL